MKVERLDQSGIQINLSLEDARLISQYLPEDAHLGTALRRRLGHKLRTLIEAAAVQTPCETGRWDGVNPIKCGAPATKVMVSACANKHIEEHPACDKHLEQAKQGHLNCSICTNNGTTNQCVYVATKEITA